MICEPQVLCTLYLVPLYLTLLVAERDTSFGQVIRAHLHFDTVAGEDLNVVHTHLTGDVSDDERSVLELHAEHSVGQGLYYRSVHFDAVLFCHTFCYLDDLDKSVSQDFPDKIKSG